MPGEYQHFVFKMDFKISEVNGQPRVFPIELGHPFSMNNHFDQFNSNWIKYLKKRYDEVYLTGEESTSYINSGFFPLEREAEIKPILVKSNAIKKSLSKNAALIVRNLETPSSYSAIEIEKSFNGKPYPLQVQNANSTLTAVMYEKILMQRLQVLLGHATAIPTALVRLSPKGDTIPSQLIAQNFSLGEAHYIIKPAFSSGAEGSEVVSQGDLILKLNKMKKTKPNSFQRSVYAGLYMLPTFMPTVFRGLALFHGLDLLENQLTPLTEDPYVLVQPVIRGISKEGYFPTYRAFVMVEKSTKTNEIRVELLDDPISIYPKNPGDILGNIGSNSKIVKVDSRDQEIIQNYLDSPEFSEYFRYIFDTPFDGLINQLTERFPELQQYAEESIRAYPPYRVFLNPDDADAKRQCEIFYILLFLIRIIQQHNKLDNRMNLVFSVFIAIDLLRIYSKLKMLELPSEAYRNRKYRKTIFYAQFALAVQNSQSSSLSTSKEKIIDYRLGMLEVTLDEILDKKQFNQNVTSLITDFHQIALDMLNDFFEIYSHLVDFKNDNLESYFIKMEEDREKASTLLTQLLNYFYCLDQFEAQVNKMNPLWNGDKEDNFYALERLWQQFTPPELIRVPSHSSKAATTWKEKGNAAFKEGNIKEASKCYIAASWINFDLPEVWFNSGMCFKKLGEIENALKTFSNALADNPYYFKARYQRLLLLCNNHDLVNARKEWEIIERDFPCYEMNEVDKEKFLTLARQHNFISRDPSTSTLTSTGLFSSSSSISQTVTSPHTLS